MKCKIERSVLTGEITCPTNKSYTHRAIFIASLAKGQSLVKNVLFSEDTKATINACKIFGAKIEHIGNHLKIQNPEGKIQPSTINALNSGTTIRIASAIAALTEGKTTLYGDESLNKRPMKPLLDALESMGAICSSDEGKPPITISGKIHGGEVSIPGNVSSQFISALIIAAPLTEKGIKLTIHDELVSKPYLDATIEVMKKFGVKVQALLPYKQYEINRQVYTPTDITIPSDFSSLALLLAASVLVGKDLKVNVTIGDLPQGDKAFFNMLEEMGVQLVINENSILVKSPKLLTGGKFDLGNTPDLLPPLAILALKTTSPLEIVNVKHARFKETDRIAILARELSKLGLKIKEKDDGLVLERPGQNKGAELNCEKDHRLFMAFCIAGFFVGDCTVSDPESVGVSYPDFIPEMAKIGAQIKSIP